MIFFFTREILYQRKCQFSRKFTKFKTLGDREILCSRNCIPAKCQFCLDSRRNPRISKIWVIAKFCTRKMSISIDSRNLIPANFKTLGDGEILCSRNCIPTKCQLCLDSRSLKPANFKNLGDREILYPRNVNFAWFAKFNTREFQNSGWSRNFVLAKLYTREMSILLDSRNLIPANFKTLGDREILCSRNVKFAWFAKFNTREFQNSGWSRNFVLAKLYTREMSILPWFAKLYPRISKIWVIAKFCTREIKYL